MAGDTDPLSARLAELGIDFICSTAVADIASLGRPTAEPVQAALIDQGYDQLASKSF